MGNMKRNMPIDPSPAEHTPKPTFTIGTTDPNLPVARKNTMDIQKHLPGIQRVFQDVRQDRDVIGSRGVKFAQQTRVNIEATTTSNGGGSRVELKAFYSKAVPIVDPQTATLVATDIEKPPCPPLLIERYVAIEKGPDPV